MNSHGKRKIQYVCVCVCVGVGVGGWGSIKNCFYNITFFRTSYGLFNPAIITSHERAITDSIY